MNDTVCPTASSDPTNFCFVCKKGGVPLFQCSRCQSFFYCGKTCQTKHWKEGGHEQNCPVHVYLNKDFQVLFKLNRDGELPVLRLLDSSADAQVHRVAGNKLFAERDFRGALESYEKAISHWDCVRGQITKNTADIECWMGANLARIHSNCCVCHLEMDRAKWMGAGLLPPELLRDVPLDKIPLHDAKLIIADVRTNGLQRSKSRRKVSLSAALEAAKTALESSQLWWKSNYRFAQVTLLMVEPKEAMKFLEHAKRGANEEDSDVQYNIVSEKKSAIKTIESLESQVKMVLMALNETYKEKESDEEQKEGSIQKYLDANMTKIGGDHSRVPISKMRPEMIAVRLCAAVEGARPGHLPALEVEEMKTNQREAARVLSLVLSAISAPPLEFFPPDGSDERVPPISVNLLAFYIRAAILPARLVEMDVEGVACRTTEWMTDEDAYCIATHNYVEVEIKHSVDRGHAKSFGQTGGGGCMPCSYRLLRSGCSDWGDGLRMAAHKGNIDVLCFFLNRLLSGVTGCTALKAILEQDEMGCNAMMHAANDNFTGLSGLSIRLMTHAASFKPGPSKGKDVCISSKDASLALNSTDRSGYTPAMASVSLRNESALAALVGLRAKLYVKKDGVMSSAHQKMSEILVQQLLNDPSIRERFRSLLRSIRACTNDNASCSYCGKPPRSRVEKMPHCSKCLRARYCNAKCQKADFKRHKCYCTAKVEKDVAWFAKHIHLHCP